MDTVPSCDPGVFYLGRLCKRSHNWNGAHRSLRFRADRDCVLCNQVRDHPRGLARGKERWATRIALVNKIKLERGCADCGYRVHPAALHFDHLPGSAKAGGISRLCGWSTLDKVLAEIAKCEVVCANCHAVRTALRRDAMKARAG